MKNIDLVDGIIGGVTLMALAGLIWGNPGPELTNTLNTVLWAGLVGLGLKKAPSTLGKQ